MPNETTPETPTVPRWADRLASAACLALILTAIVWAVVQIFNLSQPNPISSSAPADAKREGQTRDPGISDGVAGRLSETPKMEKDRTTTEWVFRAGVGLACRLIWNNPGKYTNNFQVADDAWAEAQAFISTNKSTNAPK